MSRRDLEKLARKLSDKWNKVNYEVLAASMGLPVEVFFHHNQISESLENIPDLAHLVVYDVDGDYFLIHYIEEKVRRMASGLPEDKNEEELKKLMVENDQDPETLRKILLRMRGVIYYMPEGDEAVEVSRSYGYPMSADYIQDRGNEEPWILKAKYPGNDEVVKFDLSTDEFTIEPYFQGNLCLVWYHKGIHISSHKKIDNSNSKWGDSKMGFRKFLLENLRLNPANYIPGKSSEKATEASLTDLEKLLFGTESNRNLTFVFHLIHPNYASSSLMSVGRGVIMLLGVFDIGETIPDKTVRVPLQLKKLKLNEEIRGIRGSAGAVWVPEPLESQRAIDILDNGYYDTNYQINDPDLVQSDAIMLKNSAGFHLKVCPRSVRWRDSIFSEVNTIEEAYKKFAGKAYSVEFPSLVRESYGIGQVDPEGYQTLTKLADSLVEGKVIHHRTSKVMANIGLSSNKEKYLAMLFTFAAPHNHKQTVPEYYRESMLMRQKMYNLLEGVQSTFLTIGKKMLLAKKKVYGAVEDKSLPREKTIDGWVIKKISDIMASIERRDRKAIVDATETVDIFATKKIVEALELIKR